MKGERMMIPFSSLSLPLLFLLLLISFVTAGEIILFVSSTATVTTNSINTYQHSQNKKYNPHDYDNDECSRGDSLFLSSLIVHRGGGDGDGDGDDSSIGKDTCDNNEDSDSNDAIPTDENVALDIMIDRLIAEADDDGNYNSDDSTVNTDDDDSDDISNDSKYDIHNDMINDNSINMSNDMSNDIEDKGDENTSASDNNIEDKGDENMNGTKVETETETKNDIITQKKEDENSYDESKSIKYVDVTKYKKGVSPISESVSAIMEPAIAPNIITRFLLQRGHIGHILVVIITTISELLRYHLPELYHLFYNLSIQIGIYDPNNNVSHDYHSSNKHYNGDDYNNVRENIETSGRTRIHKQYSAFLSADGTSIAGGKKTSIEARRDADRANLRKLKQLASATAAATTRNDNHTNTNNYNLSLLSSMSLSARHGYLSQTFIKRWRLGQHRNQPDSKSISNSVKSKSTTISNSVNEPQSQGDTSGVSRRRLSSKSNIASLNINTNNGRRNRRTRINSNIYNNNKNKNKNKKNGLLDGFLFQNEIKDHNDIQIQQEDTTKNDWVVKAFRCYDSGNRTTLRAVPSSALIQTAKDTINTCVINMNICDEDYEKDTTRTATTATTLFLNTTNINVTTIKNATHPINNNSARTKKRRSHTKIHNNVYRTKKTIHNTNNSGSNSKISSSTSSVTNINSNNNGMMKNMNLMGKHLRTVVGAAATNSGVSSSFSSRRLLGAYPRDAVSIDNAGNANGVELLAAKYGYGTLHDDDNEDYHHQHRQHNKQNLFGAKGYDDKNEQFMGEGRKHGRQQKRRRRRRQSEDGAKKENNISLSFELLSSTSSSSPSFIMGKRGRQHKNQIQRRVRTDLPFKKDHTLDDFSLNVIKDNIHESSSPASSSILTTPNKKSVPSFTQRRRRSISLSKNNDNDSSRVRAPMERSLIDTHSDSPATIKRIGTLYSDSRYRRRRGESRNEKHISKSNASSPRNDSLEVVSPMERIKNKDK